jgi:hypothetical protein
LLVSAWGWLGFNETRGAGWALTKPVERAGWALMNRVGLAGLQWSAWVMHNFTDDDGERLAGHKARVVSVGRPNLLTNFTAYRKLTTAVGPSQAYEKGGRCVKCTSDMDRSEVLVSARMNFRLSNTHASIA